MSGGNDSASSSGKSEAEIAFELVNKLKGQGVWGEKNMGPILDMFAECLDAAKGLRAYPGQNRINAAVKAPGPSVQAAPQTTAAAPQPTQAQMQAQAQAQAQAQVQRQAQLQQAQTQRAPQPAYKQG